MPVPQGKQKEYSTIVASQIKRLKKKGKSPSEALARAKAMADSAVKKPSGNTLGGK